MYSDLSFTGLIISRISTFIRETLKSIISENQFLWEGQKSHSRLTTLIMSLYDSKPKIDTNNSAFHTTNLVLKDSDIFYRHCSSTDYLTKDCTTPIQCNECSSDEHLSTTILLENWWAASYWKSRWWAKRSRCRNLILGQDLKYSLQDNIIELSNLCSSF